ncbi:hypothetical protein IE81DRAFT_349463 [Ceraceosorus guamensis]|uniref:Uncharacterized protein n=1 Tax=Ceraceosorus guamensis TaxID=1522189 RepID=A0A316VRG5_9BASI|nr:hypothetical protein IE81DRAFT_349463 [Ceraceosorus guamensis]PWN40186.1 hypothetical protein IE81DRAFT_349463 [Ceraceosorus guamensis]
MTASSFPPPPMSDASVSVQIIHVSLEDVKHVCDTLLLVRNSPNFKTSMHSKVPNQSSPFWVLFGDVPLGTVRAPHLQSTAHKMQNADKEFASMSRIRKDCHLAINRSHAVAARDGLEAMIAAFDAYEQEATENLTGAAGYMAAAMAHEDALEQLEAIVSAQGSHKEAGHGRSVQYKAALTALHGCGKALQAYNIEPTEEDDLPEVISTLRGRMPIQSGVPSSAFEVGRGGGSSFTSSSSSSNSSNSNSNSSNSTITTTSSSSSSSSTNGSNGSTGSTSNTSNTSNTSRSNKRGLEDDAEGAPVRVFRFRVKEEEP